MKRGLLAISILALVSQAFGATTDVAGKWKWTLERNGDSIPIVMDLKQEGEKIFGKITAGEDRQMEIREGKISADGKLGFYIHIERDSGPMKITFSGKVDQDKIAGKSEFTTGQGERREHDWNAKREESRNLTGSWTSTFKRSDGTAMETTLRLKQSGEKLSGTQSLNDNEAEIRDGKVQGDEVSFSTIREREGRTVTAKYRGKIQKDSTIKGEIESDWTGEVRKLEWEAKKAK